MARRDAQRTQQIESSNLIPFLGLMSLLIPMLLMNVQFGRLAVISSEVPGLCAAPCDTPQAPRLGLTLTVSGQGLLLSGEDVALNGGLRLPCVDGRCARPADYDLGGLSAALTELKSRHPAERGVTLAVTDEVPFELMVALFDTTRGSPDAPLFPDPMVSAVIGAL
jgi:hypothetical protein